MIREVIRAEDVPTRRDGWAWGVALAFVVLTLAALVLIPVVVQRRVDQQRKAIAGAEPARTLLMSLQFNLVREMSTLNQYALSADVEYVRTFMAARESERQIWGELAPVAASLGADVHKRFIAARTITESWHQQLNEPELLGHAPASLSILLRSGVRQDFAELLNATARLDSTIVSVTSRHRARIEAAERTGLVLTFVSGGLALLAAGVVGALVLRIRRLAAESERRRRESAEALAQSTRATEARERLLRGITHDVKNPLGAARGYAELLRLEATGRLNAKQQKFVVGVERSIDSALAIISDLLDLARADSGGITVQRVQTELNELARHAVDDHRAAAAANGHEIVMADAVAALHSYTDPLRVRQILDNLISNAIKYTPPPGRIVVCTEANAGDTPFQGRAIAIRVADTGPGIPADQRERIFDEFTRLDDRDEAHGHGLGLAIARRMARLLGGELGLAESKGPGSTFVLWLPHRT